MSRQYRAYKAIYDISTRLYAATGWGFFKSLKEQAYEHLWEKWMEVNTAK